MTVILRGTSEEYPETRTHPVAFVETDGTPQNTRVVLVTKDGTKIDVTECCRAVKKDAGSPIVELTLFAIAPRDHLHGLPDELDRELDVSV